MTLSPRQRRRLMFALAVVGCAGLAALLVLNAFQDNLVFFHSSSEVAEGKMPPERRFRLGGLVEEGSVKRIDGATVTFKVTDLVHAVPVRYVGVLPDLFREGQGVVAEGKLGRDGVFVASEVLARHDETYMPPAAAKALKDAGQWRGPTPPGAPSRSGPQPAPAGAAP